MFIRLVIGWVLASSLLAQTQGQVWRRSSLARQGLHHSSISGRFVDGEGKPVSGIHVQIVEWLNPPGEYPTARTSSGADGCFRFSDVSTSHLGPEFPRDGFSALCVVDRYLRTFVSATPKFGALGTQVSIDFKTMSFPSPIAIPERMYGRY